MIEKTELHSVILQHIIDKGHAPNLADLSIIMEADEPEITQALYALQDYHGVVLHPNEPKIWVIHPFSLAPTNFLVKSQSGKWWGNCAWCSLGVAALLKEDVSILTSYGAYGEPLQIHIQNGEILEKNLVVHFPIPMKKAWDNVIYTCSTMLVFKDKEQVKQWSSDHQIPMGDVQPIAKIWDFAQKWYGNHLAVDWKKWTVQEAKEIFEEFGLRHEVWRLEESGERF